MKLTTAIMVAGAALAASAAPASALDLNFATPSSPQHQRLVGGIEPYLKRIEEKSGGEIKGRIFAGGQLLGTRDVLDGLKNGVTQTADIIPHFAPKDLPHNMALANMVTYGSDPLAVSAAATEMMLLGCAECMQDYKNNNSIILASFATTGYIFLCRADLAGPEALKGLRVRSAGIFSDVLTQLGATPVNVPAYESAEALERNIVDCVNGPIEWLESFGLQDSVKHIYNNSLGVNRALATYVINMDTWNSASAEQRQMIIDEMPQLMADTNFAYNIEGAKQARAFAEGAGIPIDNGSPELQAAMTPSADIAPAIAKLSEDLGVTNSAELIEKFKTHLTKWEGILAEIGDDKDAYRDALDREIYSKLSTDM